MAKLPGAFELMATAASPAINFGRGILIFGPSSLWLCNPYQKIKKRDSILTLDWDQFNEYIAPKRLKVYKPI